MKKELQKFSSESIKGRLKKIEVSESYSEMVKEGLETSVFGQEEACATVARIVTIFEAGLSNPDRPAGVVVFLGPTGVGKSELGKAAAVQLFGEKWKEHYKKVNCSDYSESHTISRFVGSPPGYVGYGDETVFDNDFLENKNVIVFDEIEKANIALWRLLLAVFETGRMEARVGIGDGDTIEEELDFTKSLIILTTNVGAEQMQEVQRVSLGFLGNEKKPDVQGAAVKGLKRHFAEIPEFLGRVDEFVVFKPLERPTYLKIYWKFVEEISELMSGVGVYFTTTNELAEHLINQAVEGGEYGARDIRHVLHRELVLPLADLVSSDSNKKGMVADFEDGKIVFYDLTPELGEETLEELAKKKEIKMTDDGEEYLNFMELMEIDATDDGYAWILEDEEVGVVMKKLLYVADYEKWKNLVDRIQEIGQSEKDKARRVLGDAFKMMDDYELRRKYPEEWEVFKTVLVSFGVFIDE